MATYTINNLFTGEVYEVPANYEGMARAFDDHTGVLIGPSVYDYLLKTGHATIDFQENGQWKFWGITQKPNNKNEFDLFFDLV